MLKRPSITARAIAFVAIASLCLVSIDVWRSWTARSVQIDEMTVATSNLSRALAQHADDTFKEADTALLNIVSRAEDDGTSTDKLEDLKHLFAAQMLVLPQVDGFYLFDENGQLLVNSQHVMSTPYNNADRDYFIYHRTHPDNEALISRPLVSRTTGKLVIPISRRINHVDGSFAGVATATIQIDFFRNFFNRLEIGQAGAVAIVTNDGTMLVRRPYSDSLVGKSMRNTELYQQYVAHGPVGSAFITSAQDGINRLNSFRAITDYPLFAAAALSKEEILSDWWRDTLMHSAGVLMLSMVIGFFGWRLVEQIRRREIAEAEARQARDALSSLNETLEGLALQDGLTGLANRRHFDAALATEFARARRSGSSLSLILIDVDSFKQFNDMYGHPAGDECLRAVSRALQGAAPKRSSDVAARYGGEEIAVLLPETPMAGAMAVAERIRVAVLGLAIPHAKGPAGFVSISAGVAVVVPVRESSQPGMLVAAADHALYRAKSTGRNKVCAADELVLNA